MTQQIPLLIPHPLSEMSGYLVTLLFGKEVVEPQKRKDRISGITVRPVGLPVIGQGELFQ